MISSWRTVFHGDFYQHQYLRLNGFASGSTYLGVISQGIHGELGKRLGVFDKFEKVFPFASILLSGISYRLCPYGDICILEQQECLHGTKLALPTFNITSHPSHSPSSTRNDSRINRD